MQKGGTKKELFPPQAQEPPGLEYKMKPEPDFESHRASEPKLKDKVCVVTGGDSGIGRAVAVAFAAEGAKIAVIYLNEDEDAEETAAVIRREHRKECFLVRADLSKEKECTDAIGKVIGRFESIDVLVNNAATHTPAESLSDITSEQLLHTFSVNIFSMFWLTQAALPYMRKGSSIINTSSVTAYRGSAHLIDYASTKGAIVSFTRSLAANLIKKGIRVNGVAPGPIWTPLVVSSFDEEKVQTFGSDSPMGRPGQPSEVAPAYVFLASQDASYITGQFIHPNGGEIING